VSAYTTLSPNDLRALLVSFWGESLAIEPTATGMLFTMPASYPDGCQIVLELGRMPPRGVRLSDRGKTLSWLAGQGQNIETDAMRRHLKRLCAEHSLTEEHGMLVRWLEVPLNASDIHVFAEGLVAVSRLDILNDNRIGR
jgi:hypothetical protein